METVAFTRMADGTREEYELLGHKFKQHLGGGVSRQVLSLLHALKGPKLGYQVDRFEHSLQSASRALRDGRNDDYVVVALLHDIGDTVAPYNHSQLVASILAPYIDERLLWIVRYHGLFQGYYYFHHLGLDRNERERFREHPWFDDCVEFCELYDQCCFDPSYPTLGLPEFVPLVEKVLSVTPWSATVSPAPLAGA